jgi:hypothetical protein
MSKKYDAGVKEYRDTYWTPDYVPLDTDLLACFKCTGQEGVPREEVAAAVAAESSTGTWSTVWSELLTDLDFYKGRCYRIEDVPGDKDAFYAFIAYPLDLFEEGSITNVLTSLVGNVFGFKALRNLRLEDIRFPMAFIKTCMGPPNGIVVERDRMAGKVWLQAAPPGTGRLESRHIAWKDKGCTVAVPLDEVRLDKSKPAQDVVGLIEDGWLEVKLPHWACPLIQISGGKAA